MMQLAYHIHTILFQVWVHYRQDFMEMMLHHFTAVLLILCSNFLDLQRIGILILLAHDISDIFVYGSKALVDSHYKKTLTFFSVSLIVSWFYTRLYVFPFVIIRSVITEPFRLKLSGVFPFKSYVNNMIVWTPASFLLLLQALHVYWITKIVKVVIQTIVKGRSLEWQDDIKKDTALETREHEENALAGLRRRFNAASPLAAANTWLMTQLSPVDLEGQALAPMETRSFFAEKSD